MEYTPSDKEKNLDHSELLKLLSYDPLTGIFIRKERPYRLKRWNTRYANKEAGFKRKSKYVEIYINDSKFLAHRLAYFYIHKVWVKEIDHDNGIPDDNRIINLIPRSHSDNGKNLKLCSRNKSGFTGVHFFKRDNNWTAHITVNYKRINLGYFNTIEGAIEARKQANIKYNFNKNHGRKTTNIAVIH